LFPLLTISFLGLDNPMISAVFPEVGLKFFFLDSPFPLQCAFDTFLFHPSHVDLLRFSDGRKLLVRIVSVGEWQNSCPFLFSLP